MADMAKDKSESCTSAVRNEHNLPGGVRRQEDRISTKKQGRYSRYCVLVRLLTNFRQYRILLFVNIVYNPTRVVQCKELAKLGNIVAETLFPVMFPRWLN